MSDDVLVNNSSSEELPATEISKVESAGTEQKREGTLLADQGAADVKPESPEGYKFNFKPDTVLDNELLTQFKAMAHKKGMSQEEAQEYASFYEQAARKSVAEAEATIIKQEKDFRQQCQADPEIGGAKFDETLAYATRAVEKFATPNLLSVLHESGYGSHPEVVRFCAKVGKALGEKGMAKGEETGKPASFAELMYPSMSK